MAYKIQSEEELLELVNELAHVLTNMRDAQKQWDRYYGFNNKNRKNYWEQKGDQLIERLNLTAQQKVTPPQIENKKDP